MKAVLPAFAYCFKHIHQKGKPGKCRRKEKEHRKHTAQGHLLKNLAESNKDQGSATGGAMPKANMAGIMAKPLSMAAAVSKPLADYRSSSIAPDLA